MLTKCLCRSFYFGLFVLFRTTFSLSHTHQLYVGSFFNLNRHNLFVQQLTLAMVPFRLKIYVSNVLVWVESEKPSNQDMKRGEKTTRTTTIATNNNTSNNNTALHINFPLFSRGLNAIWCLPIEILFCPWTKIFGHSHTNRILYSRSTSRLAHSVSKWIETIKTESSQYSVLYTPKFAQTQTHTHYCID